jgi:two-component system cell cycle sensor histidine kinase/response regulator CckA
MSTSQARTHELLTVPVGSRSDAIVLLNADGSVRFASQQCAELLGHPGNERVCQNGFDVMHPDDQPMAHAALADCRDRPGVPITITCRAKHKNGTWIEIEATGVNRLSDPNILAVVVNLRDVLERRATEEALRASEDRLRRSEAQYRSLIYGAAYGIYRSTEDGRILDANPALAGMLGYSSVKELLTRNMLDLYRSPEDRAALLATGVHREHGIGEVYWKRKDGVPILVRLSARIIEGDEEGVTCYETIAEDITERRALEEQLRQAQKMEAVGRLARGVAHDFNNVLAAIIGYSELITARLHPDSAVSHDALEIRRAAERGAMLTRQLLTFSRSQALEPRVVDLHAVLKEDERMLRQLVGEGVALRLETIGPAPRVSIEPGQLDQVLLNLLVNGRDAMPEGGTVTVSIDAVILGARDIVRYPGALSGSYARIRVKDTGTGIDPLTQPHVFEPFFTTKDPSKGTGLGLSIVYGIAKDAGGTVTFTTTTGEGSTFEVLLPLVSETPA